MYDIYYLSCVWLSRKFHLRLQITQCKSRNSIGLCRVHEEVPPRPLCRLHTLLISLMSSGWDACDHLIQFKWGNLYSCLVLLGNCLVVWFKLLLQTWKFHHVSYKQVCPKDTHVSIHSLESNIMIENSPSWGIAEGTIQSIYVSLRSRFDTGNDPRKKPANILLQSIVQKSFNVSKLKMSTWILQGSAIWAP